jgi:hypothetical protein
MSYQHFNQNVLEFYTNRSNSSIVTLEIEDDRVNSLGWNQKFTEILISDWESLLKEINGIPQYFGLIAIQCLAASQMEKDEEGEIGQTNYRKRLEKILGLQEGSQLPSLFKGNDPDNHIQENIWYQAKNYFKKNHGLILSIPSRTTRPGRYVQYPKSQCLLNKEDLKYFTSFYSENLRQGEEISFKNFNAILESQITSILQGATDRTKDLLSQETKKAKCYEQIYNNFLQWDGFVANIGYNVNRKLIHNVQSMANIYMLFENDKPVFYLDRVIVNINQILKLPGYKYFYKNIILFSPSEYYPNEYEDSRYLYKGNDCYILLDKSKSSTVLDELNKIEMSWNISTDHILLKISVNALMPSSLKQFILDETPIHLKGGIRLSRKREYLQGFGPYIENDIKYIIIKDHKSIDYNCQSAIPGIYKVRVTGHGDKKFNILDIKEIYKEIECKQKGWNLTSYSIEESKIDLEGMNLYSKVIEEKIKIRTWIEWQSSNANIIANKNFVNLNQEYKIWKYLK